MEMFCTLPNRFNLPSARQKSARLLVSLILVDVLAGCSHSHASHGLHRGDHARHVIVFPSTREGAREPCAESGQHIEPTGATMLLPGWLSPGEAFC